MTSDMCVFGMTVLQMDEESGEQSEQLVVKPTGWATNADEIAKALSKRCDNAGRPAWQQHRHARLLNGLAKKCEVYPVELAKAIMVGLVNELKKRGEYHEGEIGYIDAEEPEPQLEEYWPETTWSQGVEVGDSITNLVLPKDLVDVAKQEELELI